MSLMCNVFASLEPDHSVINSSELFWILITWLLSLWFQTTRYYCPNLLFLKQRTTENSLKSILFFAEGFKVEIMINFKCISWGYQ